MSKPEEVGERQNTGRPLRFKKYGKCIPVHPRIYAHVKIYLHAKIRRDITASGFWKQTFAMLEFYFRFRLLLLRHHRHVILHLPIKFRTNRTICDRVMTSYPSSRWRHCITIPLPVSVFKVESTCILNFSEISQFTAEILLLPVSENKRPPRWNSTSGSDFYVCVTIGMSFCICLPNFVQIGPPAT